MPILSTGTWGEKKTSRQRSHRICNGTPQSQSTEHMGSAAGTTHLNIPYHWWKIHEFWRITLNQTSPEGHAYSGREGKKSQMRTRNQGGRGNLQPTDIDLLSIHTTLHLLTGELKRVRSFWCDLWSHEKHPLCSTEKSRMQLIQEQEGLEQFSLTQYFRTKFA